jgi:hypothetical protein
VLAVPGILLLAAGLLLYGGSIAAAIVHVGKQYSSAMAGTGSLRLNAAFAAAGKRWYYLLAAILGGVLLAVGR